VNNLSVTLEASELERLLKEAPRKIFNAQRSAIRTTTTFAQKMLKQRMGAATGLPSAVFKVYRVRSRASDSKGVVWLGMKPVSAKYAGRLSQEAAGASAGQYYWAGGFVASMQNGGTPSIFKRKGAKRLPIVEQVVELPMAQAVGADVYQLTQSELQRRYLEKLEAALR